MRDGARGLVVFAVALVVRGSVLLDARDAPFWRVPLVDEAAYIELARGVLAQTPLPHGAWYVAPGYAWFLAAVFAAGGGLVAAKVANLLAGAVSAYLVWRLSRRVAGPGAAFLAGLVWALYPAALLQELLVLKSALAVLCVLLALVAIPWRSLESDPLDAPHPDVLPRSDRRRAARWLGAGIALGGATLLRGELWILGAVVASVAAWAHHRRWDGAPPRRAAALLLLGLGVCILVPAAQNHRGSGDWVPIAFGAGPNFYIGNHAAADGGYVPLRPDRSEPQQEEADAVLLASDALQHAASPGEVSRYWFGRGGAWWGRQPWRAVALTAKKWALLWGPWELADVISTAVASRWVVLLRNPLAGPALILPAALAGVWIARRRRAAWPLAAFLIGAQLAIVPFFLFERFRLHLVAVALPFAAIAAERAADLLRTRAWRRLGVGIAATAVLGAVLALARAPRDPVVLRVNIGEMLFDDGQYAAALREYEAVRVQSPDAWRVNINIANTFVALGRPHEALAALARVLPELHAEGERTGWPSAEELAYCHELAGDLEVEFGAATLAVTHYEQALRWATPAAQLALRAKLAALGGAGRR